ncbi:lycopene cyclase family protein [Algoriphagus sediminis]|uniref:Lycopene cyclase family protein n=1 Tax=Algoriphagus sediminis TaxID=3057113 RepID=A0ABT7YDK6_9BACT|nr:lycopene cyclase family protein [Algoriphagus sediminis]MDN3204609.1 lycopene cyclase family protein [Algoriphagus sediminis]
MKEFDYIFAGAGCAGLSMIYHVLNSPLKDKRILLIDPHFGEIPNKTWCYWAKEALPIHPEKSLNQHWSKFSLGTKNQNRTYEFDQLKYWHINSKEFYEFILPQINSSDSIEIVQDSVVEIYENDSEAFVRTKSESFSSKYVFDSRLSEKNNQNSNSLKQVFAGWRVEFDSPVFDPTTFSLMEVDDSSSKDFSFFYVLPHSDRSALIEFTKYDTDRTSLKELKGAIKDYISDKFGDIEYKITFEEDGIIPMSTLHNSIHSERLIPIGTRAGWTKPSTGYTFFTIQKNCEILLEKLQNGEPLSLTPKESRFKFYDNILLNIAHNWPSQLKTVFLNLFHQNPPDQVFRFLGEQTSLREEFQILRRLRFGIFIKSLITYGKY